MERNGLNSATEQSKGKCQMVDSGYCGSMVQFAIQKYGPDENRRENRVHKFGGTEEVEQKIESQSKNN